MEWSGRFHLHRVDDWFAVVTVRLTLKREQPASWPDVSSLPVATHLLSSLRTAKAPNFIMRVRRKTKPVDTVKAQSLAEVSKPNLCRMCNHR